MFVMGITVAAQTFLNQLAICDVFVQAYSSSHTLLDRVSNINIGTLALLTC